MGSAAGIEASMTLLLLEAPTAIGEFVQGTGVTAGRADIPAGKTVFVDLDVEEASIDASPAAGDGAGEASRAVGVDADIASAGADDSAAGASPAAAGEGAASTSAVASFWPFASVMMVGITWIG